MAVYYRLHQDNRENSTTKGKWLARTAMIDTVNLEALAEIMQNNCTVKISDIKGVLRELQEVMTDQLQSGKHVKIDGLGTFYIGLESNGAASAKEFDANVNIKGMHVCFIRERHKGQGKTSVYSLTSGVKFEELPKYNVVK